MMSLVLCFKAKPMKKSYSNSKKIFRMSGLIPMLVYVIVLLPFGACRKNDHPFPPGSAELHKIKHVVVIYLENHSFDNLYGQFSGANGLANANPSNTTQVDSAGNPFKVLPPVPGSTLFPTNLANTFFDIDQYVPNDMIIPDVLHRYYQEQMQIDGGKMDKYALFNTSAGLSQGYYKTSLLPLLEMAQNYTLCDNFYHSAFGGSFLNHQWLIAAASPTFPNAPTGSIAVLDQSGKLIKDGAVTPDGYVVNTSFTVNAPHPATADPATLVPNQTAPTIGDRLSDKHISWAWYSGGWDSAIAGKPDPLFQFHHQPFAFFLNYADGTQAKKDHLLDETRFIDAAKKGTLPSVSFVKPIGSNNEHPGYADLLTGENHTLELINDVLNGPDGNDAAIIITYDENGGFWDHVAPPVIDKKWGPGTRVPAIIISPFAKRGYIDHTQYETISILSFIEKIWDLKPLNDRDGNANPLQNAFDFSQFPGSGYGHK
jgi:phospholipase C